MYKLLIVVAFFIRLILMPISGHSDLLVINMFPGLLQKEQVIDILTYSKEEVRRENFSYYPPLVYYTIGFFQFSYKYFSDTFSPWMNQLREAYEGGFSGHTVDYIKKIENEMLFRDLFLAKSPYLFFDIACVFLLLKLIRKRVIAKGASILWLYNPILLYDTYIYGQFDTLPAFFVLLGFLLIAKSSQLGILAIGIAAAYKNYALFFIPILALIWGGSYLNKFKLMLLALLPTFIFAIPTLINTPSEAIFTVFNRILLTHKRPLEGWALYSPLVRYATFLTAYFLVVLLAFWMKIKNKWSISIGFCYISVLLLVTFAPRTQFHYLIWLTPLTILWFKDIKTASKVILIQAISFFSYKSLANQLQLGLFAPIDPDFFSNLPTFNSLIEQIIPYWIISTIGFITFHMFNFVLIGTILIKLLFKERTEDRK